MKLAVVGAGLVSPWARSLAEHAFFLRAGVPGPPASPFRTADDKPLKGRVCPWLGARADFPTRVGDLARTALTEALAPLLAAGLPLPATVFACASRARSAPPPATAPHAPPGPAPGAQGASVADLVEDALASLGKRVRPDRAWDEAGVFSAIERADKLITEDARRFVAVVAADSLVTIDALTEWVTRGPGPWGGRRLPRSEGAAAFVVTSPAAARDARLPVLATIEHASTFADAATDADDDPIEARAMTAALRALSPRRFRYAYGQTTTDALRSTEWHLATARNRARFDEEHVLGSIEAHVGAVGAAAGAMNLAFGVAELRHRTTRIPFDRAASLLAWSISPDGTRGLAACTVEGL